MRFLKNLQTPYMGAMIKLNKRSFAIDFRQDRAILMICIGIALIFWLLVKLSQTYTSDKAVELSFRIPQELAFRDAPPQDLVIEMEGTGWDLLFEYFASTAVPLQYDLLDRRQLILSRNSLRSDLQDELFSGDLRITDINYDRIELVLEDRVTRRVPILLHSRLAFAPEHQLRGPVSLEPDSVAITGPVSLIDSVDFWSTDSLIMTNLKSSLNAELPLQKPPREISLDPRAIQAIISMEQFTQKSLFVPLTVQNAPDSVQVFPRQIAVTCVLGLSQYEKVNSADFKFIIDLDTVDLQAENNAVLIKMVEQPDSVRNIQFTPKAAKYFIVQDSLIEQPLPSLEE